MYKSVAEAMDALESVLDTFQWAYPDRSENRGEVELNRETSELILCVWVRDNEDPDDESVKELHATIPVTTQDAPEQIRALIHDFLCHEADEQMWFGESRPFYPH